MKMFDSTTGEQTWITPINLQQSLGHFDLDPCAADVMPYRTADRMVTKDEDGLTVDWSGKRVWLNPPYGKAISAFLEKMTNVVALLPCRTDTRWFHELVVPKMKAVMFMKGRVSFIPKNNPKTQMPAFASILVAYSDYDVEMIRMSGIDGVIMTRQEIK